MNFNLSKESLRDIKTVLSRHPAVSRAVVFGSRALGRNRGNSDIDLALDGDLSALEAERIALELEEISLPYQFDVQALSQINHRELREHIDRVGSVLYLKEDAAGVK